MDTIQRSSYFSSTSSSSDVEISRSPLGFEILPNWKKSQERATKGRQLRDTKFASSSGSTNRRSRNINRSPRQVRRNERERGRKARLNAAFKVLRNVIPFYTDGLNKEKLTQVQVLRLAAKYIMTLSDILGSDSSENEDEIFASQLHEYRMNYEMMTYAAGQ